MNAEQGQDWRTRPAMVGLVLGLLAAAQMALAATVNPFHYPWPPWAVHALQGAILAHPILLYPMWAALSRSGLAWRSLVASLLGVVVVWLDFWPCSLELVAIRATVILVAFAFVAAGFWLIRKASGSQIIPFGATPTSRRFRFQYRLRHLLEGMFLTACVLAVFRIYFPHGIPRWWASVGGEIPEAAMVLVMLLPPAIVPWAVLADHVRGKRALLLAVICWPALDYGLFQLMSWSSLPRGITSRSMLRDVILFVQCGASVAGLIFALVFRWLGYRIVHAESEKVAVAENDSGQ